MLRKVYIEALLRLNEIEFNSLVRRMGKTNDINKLYRYARAASEKIMEKAGLYCSLRK